MKPIDILNPINSQWDEFKKNDNNDLKIPTDEKNAIDEFLNTIFALGKSISVSKNINSRIYIANNSLLTALVKKFSAALNQINSTTNNNLELIQALSLILNQILLSLHSSILLLVNNNENGEKIIADISHGLANYVAQYKEAKDDIDYQITQFNTWLEKKEAIDAKCKNLENELKKASDGLSDINQIKSKATEESQSISETKKEIATLKEGAENTTLELNSLKRSIEKEQEELEKAKMSHGKLEEDIKNLLPSAASGVLAHAFENRAKKFTLSKCGWCIGFIIAIAGLCLIGYDLLKSINQPHALGYWPFLVEKLVLASPFIWFGWFSAVQYGNTIRLQEDYEFKSATSKAFVGFKDYFEYLSKVSVEGIDGNAKNAMILLSEKTIHILANEPGRILDKTHKDVSIFSGLFSRTRKKHHMSEKNNGTSAQ